MHKASGWLVLLLTVSLWGCALAPSSPVQVNAPDSSPHEGLPDGEGWWYARFHIARPDGEPARWHIGTLLAGEVIAPVIDRHHGDISMWRIHRRASQDEYGHVFSYIFIRPPQGRSVSTAISNTVQSLSVSTRTAT